MRGQRLFTRPIEPSDSDAIRSFLRRAPDEAVPVSGLVGKLVGDLVAVLAAVPDGNGIVLCDLVVAERMRHKRIGRGMIEALAGFASEAGATEIAVRDARGGDDFLRRVGFHERSGIWVRRIEPR